MTDLVRLTGRSTDHLVSLFGTNQFIHRDMEQSLIKLFKAAKKDGFDLVATSIYRSYEAQKSIWNNKCSGKRIILDSDSNPVELKDKSPLEILFLILRWSAIPGGSRHHWGSDLDLYDQKAVSTDYKVMLIPAEYEKFGPFYQANLWLNENMMDYGFFKPYTIDKGGIAAEPWHLSYRPISDYYLSLYTYEKFMENLEISDFMLLDLATTHSKEIYNRFILLP